MNFLNMGCFLVFLKNILQKNKNNKKMNEDS